MSESGSVREAAARAGLREALRLAIATEHQLHEAGEAEQAGARRWAARAALAQGKEEVELADAARRRAAAHEARARHYRAESRRQQVHVAELKARFLQPAAPVQRWGSPIALDDDALGRRLAALERETGLEADLAELKRQLGRP